MPEKNAMSYEQMLREARSKLPEKSFSKERFEVPKVKGYIEGNKTIISNFLQVVDILHCNKDRLLKYLQRELATPAQVAGERLILGRKIGSILINKKVRQFANDFVICKECGRPDTQLIKEDRITLMKCTACGAKRTVVAKI